MPIDRRIVIISNAKTEIAPFCAGVNWYETVLFLVQIGKNLQSLVFKADKSRPNKITRPPEGGTIQSLGIKKNLMDCLRRSPTYT